VIVPVPDIPGAALPGITEEVTAISALIPGAHLLPNPTRESVLKTPSNTHHIAHFACHGRAHRINPTESQLILADHAATPLTVADISALQLDAQLAYLSACETSVTAPRLADECLHIIGTLWSIDDSTASELAADFYAHLTDDGAAPRTDRCAHALHRATKRPRARHPDGSRCVGRLHPYRHLTSAHRASQIERASWGSPSGGRRAAGRRSCSVLCRTSARAATLPDEDPDGIPTLISPRSPTAGRDSAGPSRVGTR